MPIAPFALIADADTREQSTEAPAMQRATRPRVDHQRQFGRLFQRLLGSGYHESLFERPDLVEDDYYRFINQPRGW